MRTDYNSISCLQTDQRLKNRRRSRVCGRNNGRDKSDRLCNFFNSIGCVFLDHAACFCIFVCVVNILCSVMVFDYLVLHYASLRLFHSHFSQGDTLFVCCHSSLKKDFVHLLLCKCSKNLLRFAHCFHLRLQRLNAVDDLRHYCLFFLCHFDNSSCN